MSDAGRRALCLVTTRDPLNGAANDDMGTALLDIAVRAPETGMASAEVRLVNWGNQASGPIGFMFNQVALGDKIEIAFGLAQQKTVFKGEVTGIEERYGDGVPQIVLLAEDALHRLARHRVSRAFEQQSPNAIVSTLASDAGLKPTRSSRTRPATTIQLNESDLHFLRRLAARYAAWPRRGGHDADVPQAREAAIAGDARCWRHTEAAARDRRSGAAADPDHGEGPGSDRRGRRSRPPARRCWCRRPGRRRRPRCAGLVGTAMRRSRFPRRRRRPRRPITRMRRWMRRAGGFCTAIWSASAIRM